MKRTVLSIIFMAFATISASAQLSVGAGYANSNTVHKGDMPLAGHTLHGFYAKVDYGMEIIDDFMDIVPGLRYSILSSGKNADEKGEKTGIGDQYLDIPVMADLGYEFDDDFRLFALVGPTFSFRTASTLKYGKKCDLLIGLGIGADICEHLRITATFDQGLLNLNNEKSGIRTNRNTVSLGAAFVF